MADDRVGFIGLGIMGRGMARNLVDAGFTLTIWNRTPGRDDELVEAGAARADSPAAVAEASDVVISCVSDTPDVQQVLVGDEGVVHGAVAGSLVVDCSTISPAVTREVAAALAERDVAMLDAPVSGGSEGAAQGTLSIMVGGPADQVARDWSPGFTIDLQQKDLRLVLEAFERLRLPAVGTSLISQLYATLQHRGLGGEGNHALVKALEHLSGVEVGG